MSSDKQVSILLVDDDRIILDSLSEFLSIEGFATSQSSSVPDAIKLLESETYPLVICDVNMPGRNGFELLHTVRKRWPETSFIMMTGYGTIESAVEAIKMGAYDYLTKPVVDEELKLCVERALAQQAILRENLALRAQLEERYGIGNLIGQDYRMQKVFDLISSVATSKVTVLIQGASGTGKSLVARAIHQQSDRATKPFIEVSCGAIPETLLESELFGHIRGAFTGAVANNPGKFKAADGGTIFLDEISTASPALQVKLLRVLQSQQFEALGSHKTEDVNVRVILAANRNLEDEVQEGRFREDLFYRVNVVTINMPTLSERSSDIPLLARSFLKRLAAESRRDIVDFTEEAIQLLLRYRWPGNVRELENAVERAVVLSKGQFVAPDDLPPRILDAPRQSPILPSYQATSLKEALEEPEKRIIEAALQANGWNRNLTAEQLAINRTTLYKKMKRYGLDTREHAREGV
ncbi:MAG: sigma-54-dependent transcriptional regulator [Planctomycetota bacterium]|jgi:DNA-binding NtrC family response regulator